MLTPSPHRIAADQACVALVDRFGAELRALVLFGSVARGGERPDSDVDLFVLLDRPLPRLALRWDLLEPALGPVEAKLRAARPAACIAPVVRGVSELRVGNPLYYDMTVEAERVILHDPAGQMAAFLDELAGRMRKYGSRRLHDGCKPYWDLAPGWPIGLVEL